MYAPELASLPRGGAPLGDGTWLLDPAVAHLNHGSFGAVPEPVLAAQWRAARAIEASPERFYRSNLSPAIDEVRAHVAEFLRTDPAGLALVQNATEAVQVVLDAVDLRPGSEIVYTDHTYGWVQAAIHRASLLRRAVPRRVALPVEAFAGDQHGVPGGQAFAAELAERVAAAITERTSLVVLDQITSASALSLPVDAVISAVSAATDGRVPVLIDGAHAPGLIDAPVPPIGEDHGIADADVVIDADGMIAAPGLIDSPVPARATFWLGNLHKWAFAARTAAALVVAPAYRERVEPLVASAGATAGYPRSFTYLGTQDPSAYLALPTSLAFPREHMGVSFGELRDRNSAVLAAGLARLEERLGLRAAVDQGLPLRTVALEAEGDEAGAAALAATLREQGVEVAVTSVAGRLFVRVSVQAYVGLEDFDRLAAALESTESTESTRGGRR